jgi:hypothetical protein
MGFWSRLFGRKKRPDPAVLFDSDVKKMDVRNGSFLWLLDRKAGKEFCGDFTIKKILIDLGEPDLSRKVQTKTEEGLVKIPLKEILENLGNKHRYFKFIHFKRPVHVKVFGVPHGKVELTFSAAKVLKKTTASAKTTKDPEVLENKG